MNKKVLIGGVAGAAVIATAATGAVLTAIYQIGDEDRARINDVITVAEGVGGSSSECFLLQGMYLSAGNAEFKEFSEKCDERVRSALSMERVGVSNPQVNAALNNLYEEMDNLVPQISPVLRKYQMQRDAGKTVDLNAECIIEQSDEPADEDFEKIYEAYRQVNEKIEAVKEAL